MGHLGRYRGRVAPVEIAPIIRTGCHAHPATDAAVVVNQHQALGIVKSGTHGTDVGTGSILTMHARAGHEESPSARQRLFGNRDPLLSGWHQVLLRTSSLAPRRLADGPAALALGQVNHHAPLMFGVHRAGDWCSFARPDGRVQASKPYHHGTGSHQKCSSRNRHCDSPKDSECHLPP